MRDRIGTGEDRLFATGFFGSGLLFVAMFFASGAMAAGSVSTAAEAPFAGRLQIVPRWLAMLGYGTATVLLFGVGLVPWLELLLPGWVFALGIHILISTFRRHGPWPPDGVERTR